MEIDFYVQYPELMMLNNPIILNSFAQEKGFLTPIDFQVFLERRILTELLIKKRFNSKLSFSFKPRFMKEFNSIGEVYNQLYTACEKLHSFTVINGNSRYISAMHWWTLLVKERAIDGVNSGSKKDTIIKLKNSNRKIREYVNPIDEKFNHTWLLMEMILRFSQQNNIFHREVFIPLKKALSAWVKDYESGQCKFLKIQEDKYFAVGNGGTLIPINKTLSLTDYEKVRGKKNETL
ncbi:hypothetical protein GM3708_3628 (plasmid) [Geminocystis sp. NIES-3708]|uniref:hypothetical protein n=1 Tax=Geminocystis sp. NIES-3708 TaxID=1615909 RepID=UPI0005FCCD4B|nr:hypothetical protein [Geminocystis sp. NIES-3708]BAQ63222.1 hypothetical protein GM3708_3628 [Geminocystis sp. NIES-3708]